MKTSHKIFLAGLVLVLSAVCASANSYDPGIIIKDPLNCIAPTCTVITGNSWSFTVTKLATYNVSFLNSSGNNWTSFTLTETGVAAQNITCTSTIFSCVVNPFGQNGAQMVLTAVAGLPGVIPQGSILEIGLVCKPTCWPVGVQFNVVANAPEPGTMVLLLTGAGAIYLRKKQARVAA